MSALAAATSDPPLPQAGSLADRPRAGPDRDRLLGWTVALTGARRTEELAALLEQRGARVLNLPALRILSLEDDAPLLAATRACLDGRVHIVVATTGIGFRGWLEAADSWGLGEDLRERLLLAQVFARGPKASGAVRSAGLTDRSAPSCTSTWEILHRLLEAGVAERRVVVQLHGGLLPDLPAALRAAGAEVIEVPVYRTAPPEDAQRLDRLVQLICDRDVHAVTFTSAAASSNLLAAGARLGVLDDLLQGLSDVIPVCVGSVSSAPLERLAVQTVRARHPRIGELARTVSQELERRAVSLLVANHELQVRGYGAVVDGRFRPLQPGSMAVLNVLAGQPGRVLSHAELRRGLPGASRDEHSVEMAVRRLRTGLGDPACIQNVVKRGYRLACGLTPMPDVADDDDTDSRIPTQPEGIPGPLLEDAGGTPMIREAVDRLYARLLAQPRLGAFFDDVDMPRLKRHQVLLLCQLLGGPAQYGGRELAEAHAGLGITGADYREVTKDLLDVLTELGAPPGVVAAVNAALGALKSAIAPERPASRL